MPLLMRRLRGMLGITLTWAAVFAGLGAVGGLALTIGLAAGTLPASELAPDGVYAAVLGVVARWGLVGALSGIVFAASVMVAERRKTLATLSQRRIAGWGLLAGALGTMGVVAVYVAFLVQSGFHPASWWSLAGGLVAVPVVGGALGRVTAARTLRAARRDLPTLASARTLQAESLHH